MSRYASCGKEVLRDRVHFADCNSEADAAQVAAVMNVADEATRGPLGVTLAIELCRQIAAAGRDHAD